MLTENDFLQAIRADPANALSTWLILADWLEERDDPRCELVRLQYQPQEDSLLNPGARDERIRQLLISGLDPVVPRVRNSLGMQFAWIPAGSFLMGWPDYKEPKTMGWNHAAPQHKVEISHPFYLGIYQVTQEEYEAVLGGNPSAFSPTGTEHAQCTGLNTERFPVESVSWEDAVCFCRRLSEHPQETAAGRTYQLPTEAQWEYACRGGAWTYSPTHFGESLSSREANFDGFSPLGGSEPGPDLMRPCPVGSYPPNAFGLHDMHGNVREWCADWFGRDYYNSSPLRDPTGPGEGSCRVLRGGSWLDHGQQCRTEWRLWWTPELGCNDIGFRVLLRVN